LHDIAGYVDDEPAVASSFGPTRRWESIDYREEEKMRNDAKESNEFGEEDGCGLAVGGTDIAEARNNEGEEADEEDGCREIGDGSYARGVLLIHNGSP
jgi:hypothetical protein